MSGLLHLVQPGGDWVGCGPAHGPPRCTKFNSPPINSQCINFLLFDPAPVPIKGLTRCMFVSVTNMYVRKLQRR